MDNLRILYDNVVMDSTVSVTSTAPGFSKENIKNLNKSSVWRSSNLNVQEIEFVWSESKLINMVGLAFTNLISGSKLNVKLFTNSTDVSPIFDTGDIINRFSTIPPFGFSSIGLESFAFGGGVYFSVYFNGVVCKKMVLSIDSDNLRDWITSFYDWYFSSSYMSNPDGYVEIGNIIAGNCWIPDVNPDFGLEWEYNDTSEVYRNDAGTQLVNRGTLSKSIRFNFSHLSIFDKMMLTNIIRRNGSHSPIFIDILPYSTGELKESGMIYGRLDKNSIRYVDYDRFSSQIVVNEI